MSLINEETETRIEEIRKQYVKLKRGGNVDPSVLKEDIRAFINIVKSKGESYENLRKEAEDILVDVSFIIKEGCCSPLKAKSIK